MKIPEEGETPIYEQLMAEFKERRKPPTPAKMPKKKVIEK